MTSKNIPYTRTIYSEWWWWWWWYTIARWSSQHTGRTAWPIVGGSFRRNDDTIPGCNIAVFSARTVRQIVPSVRVTRATVRSDGKLTIDHTSRTSSRQIEIRSAGRRCSRNDIIYKSTRECSAKLYYSPVAYLYGRGDMAKISPIKGSPRIFFRGGGLFKWFSNINSFYFKICTEIWAWSLTD